MKNIQELEKEIYILKMRDKMYIEVEEHFGKLYIDRSKGMNAGMIQHLYKDHVENGYDTFMKGIYEVYYEDGDSYDNGHGDVFIEIGYYNFMSVPEEYHDHIEWEESADRYKDNRTGYSIDRDLEDIL